MNNDRKQTTVCVDASIRDAINLEAEHLELSQRQMVRRLWETFQLQKERARSPNEQDPEEVLKGIYDALQKVLARDDRVIAFIREQEKVFLNPTLNNTQAIEKALKQLIKVISDLE